MKIKFIKDAPQNHEGDELELDDFHANALIAMGFAEEYKEKPIAIYIDCKNSINRKEYKTLIDPKFDMAKAKWDYFRHNEWLLNR
mgnify:CR=1 FL=1